MNYRRATTIALAGWILFAWPGAGAVFLLRAADPAGAAKPPSTAKANPPDAESRSAESGGKAADDTEEIVPIEKSDAEWRRLLTRKQFAVTRLKETEPAYTGKLWNNKKHGTYLCVCCDLELFRSEDKFDSQTGWPSFFQSISEKHVHYAQDASEDPPRVEVTCARCAAHLGHVFGDGPPPSGLRFCMNSAALKFVEAPHAAKTPAKPATKTPAKRATASRDKTSPADSSP